MSIFGSDPSKRCDNCGSVIRVAVGQPLPDECAVCRKLGDRSLLRFMREMQACETPEEREALKARFAAAKGRSWNAREREVMEASA